MNIRKTMKVEVFPVFLYNSSFPLRVWECSLPLQLLSSGFTGVLGHCFSQSWRFVRSVSYQLMEDLLNLLCFLGKSLKLAARTYTTDLYSSQNLAFSKHYRDKPSKYDGLFLTIAELGVGLPIRCIHQTIQPKLGLDSVYTWSLL